MHTDSAIASLSIALGHDVSGFNLDAPLPEVPPTNASQSTRERTIELARRENLTVRQLAQRLGGYAGLAFVGTAQTIADEMQEWLDTEGSDGARCRRAKSSSDKGAARSRPSTSAPSASLRGRM